MSSPSQLSSPSQDPPDAPSARNPPAAAERRTAPSDLRGPGDAARRPAANATATTRGLAGTTLLVSVAMSVIGTSSSLFLVDGVGATPLMVGFFFVGRALLQIVMGLTIGALSDRTSNRRGLLVVCGCFSAAGAFTFMALRNYYLLLTIGGVFFGIGSAAFAQLFAYAREWADGRAMNPSSVNARLRALSSLAWIVGPPVGLYVLATHGFRVLYLIVALFHLSAAGLALWLLPDLPRAPRRATPAGNPRAGIPPSLWLLLSGVLLLFMVNNMYQIDFTLFVTRDLGYDASFAGLPLGLSAAVEVPVIMYLGTRTERFGKGRLVLLAALCATAFFAGLPFVHAKAGLLLIQGLNALWSAIALSVPVTILQDAMPDRLGTASSLYTSSFQTGILLGGACTGVVAQWAGFTNVFFVCATLTAVATLLLTLSLRAARAEATTDRPIIGTATA